MCINLTAEFINFIKIADKQINQGLYTFIKMSKNKISIFKL